MLHVWHALKDHSVLSSAREIANLCGFGDNTKCIIQARLHLSSYGVLRQYCLMQTRMRQSQNSPNCVNPYFQEAFLFSLPLSLRKQPQRKSQETVIRLVERGKIIVLHVR